MRAVLWKTVVATIGFVLLSALITGVSIYSWHKRNIKVAQQMMADAAELKISESGLADVRAFATKYSASLSGTRNNEPCIERNCLAVATVPTDEFSQKHPKLANWRDALVRRAWRYYVHVSVKDGRVDAQQHWFVYSTPHTNLGVFSQISLPSRRICQNESFRLHHDFATHIGPKGAFNIWVDPNSTEHRDVAKFDFSCVTAFAGCSLSQVVPVAWRHYEADQRLIEAGSSKLDNAISTTCPLRDYL